MKNSLKFVLLLAAGASVTGCTSRVLPGHVGIKVEQYGSSAGVQNQTLGVGSYWTGYGTTIYQYPIYTINYAWTKGADENAKKANGKNEDEDAPSNSSSSDESFHFADKAGLQVGGDVSVSYRVDPGKAAVLFQKYRQDMASIIAGPLRNAVRASLIKQSGSMSVEDIYGAKKQDLIERVQREVAAEFAPRGLVVEQLSWAGPIDIPQNILNQINQRIHNEQEALSAQANVATVKANAEAAVAEAQGKADATRIESAALAAKPEILQQRAIEKWDGHLPEYMSGNGALPFIGSVAK